MLRHCFFLALGLGLILKGGEWFVGASVRIAAFLHMPRIVIGSTLLSLATTLPELSVSVMAGMRGESGLAVGNAVGSCICNIGLVLGVAAALRHVDVHPAALRVPLSAMFLAATLLFVLTLDLALGRRSGLLLVLLGVAYFCWDFWQHYHQRKPGANPEAAAIKREKESTGWAWLRTRSGTLIQFLTGAAVVLAGSRLLVTGAVNVADSLGIPSIVIGLTVVAIGTSLPELITAITSSRRAVADLSVGNVLGANVANLTLIVGVAALISPLAMDRLTQLLNFPAMLAMMLLLVWILYTDHRVTRREGVLLLGAYTLYVALLVARTALSRQA